MTEIPPLLQWGAILAIVGLTLNGIGTIVSLVRPKGNDLTPTLIAVTNAITQIAENMRHIPTKADLQSEMKDTRHSLANTAEGIRMHVEAGIRDLRADVIDSVSELGRQMRQDNPRR